MTENDPGPRDARTSPQDGPAVLSLWPYTLVIEGARVWAFWAAQEARDFCRSAAPQRLQREHVHMASHRQAADLAWRARAADFARQAVDPMGAERALFQPLVQRLVEALTGCPAILIRATGGDGSPRPASATASVPRATPQPVAPVPPTQTRDTTWYELRVVDQTGAPLSVVPLSLGARGIPEQFTTDVNGRVRVDDATTGFSLVAFVDLPTLRECLRPRLQTTDQAPWLTEVDSHTYVDCVAPMPMIKVASERPHTIVVQSRVECARMLELWFPTNKAFLLPEALAHIADIVTLYARQRGRKLLIVGHTDATGQPDINDPLSLDRARAVGAYLRDDVDTWLAFYADTTPAHGRWGSSEDTLMLDSLLARSGEALTDTPVRHFQATRGLTVDGLFGPETRRALIGEYMAVDGTSLPADIEPIVHGCGENFPLPKRPSDTTQDSYAHDRRVELFFFDGDLGVLPAPPGEISGPDSLAYPLWQRRASQTHDFVVRHGDDLGHLSDLHFVLTSRSGHMVWPGVSLTVQTPEGVAECTTDARGTVLLPALAPGDYPVTVRIAGREDRFVVPSVPAGVEPLRIPTDLSIEVQTHD